MRIACLQNHPVEGPALIADWAQATGHDLTIFAGYEGTFPTPEQADALIIMGGPMSVHGAAHDANISGALETVSAFLWAECPILGICLGAQMLAMAAGGQVVPGNQKEIGWFPITTSDGATSSALASLPADATVFHWHGEQIVAPNAATVIASSAACPVQAFHLAPHQIGLQFHLEVSGSSVTGMLQEFADDIESGGTGVQTADEISTGYARNGENCRVWLHQLLEQWTASTP